MDFSNYVEAELLVLIPVLYGIGAVVKNSETINDKYIPAILTLVGVALSCLYVFSVCGVNAMSVFTAIVQGVLVAAAAVYTNQIIKQADK